MNVNRVTIAGYLGRDPELRHTPKGSAVCNLNVAVTRRWKDEVGTQKEETTWVGCTAFGKQAETLAQYLKKGSCIYLEGRLKNDSWDDKKTGEKRTKTGVVIDGFQFVGKLEGSAALAKPSTQPEPAAASETDDIPF
jgi:single-strand DNA-binding protein